MKQRVPVMRPGAVLIALGCLVLVGAGVAVAGIWAAAAMGSEGRLTLRAPVSEQEALVTEPGVLRMLGPEVEVNVSGTEGTFVGIGPERDVEAVVDSRSAQRIDGGDVNPWGTSTLDVRDVSGDEPLTDPAAADVWVVGRQVQSEAPLTWTDRDGSWSMVVAPSVDSSDATVSLTWRESDWFLLALVAAVLGVLIGAGAGYLLVRSLADRRAVQSTGTSDQGSTRIRVPLTVVALLTALSATTALAGCGVRPDGNAAGQRTAQQAAPIDADIADRVVTDVSRSREQADTALDPELLLPRTVGPELARARAAYTISAATAPNRQPPASVIGGVRGYLLPAFSGWPRWYIATISSSANPVAQVLVLTSGSARDPYSLWARLRLLPGERLPETDPAGAEPLSADAPGLVTTPENVAARYADVLTKGESSAYAEAFVDDTFRDQLIARLAADRAVFDDLATLTETHAIDPENLLAVRTADGGALVLAAMTATTKITVERGRITLPPRLAALSGATQLETAGTVTTQEVVAFAVPPEGGGQMRVLAADEGITAVDAG